MAKRLDANDLARVGTHQLQQAATCLTRRRVVLPDAAPGQDSNRSNREA
jgi:hypothetical protein